MAQTVIDFPVGGPYTIDDTVLNAALLFKGLLP